jgi:hypothetical protein
MVKNRFIHITNWSLISDNDPWTAPERSGLRLMGTVKGHPDKPDGSDIVTSKIITVKGRRCTTATGNEYELVGDPCAEYMNYLSEIGVAYDPVQPIRTKGPPRRNNAPSRV